MKKDTNNKCENIENCSSCSFCYSCSYCSYCSFCSFCSFCSYCSYCSSCSFCFYCYSCSSCSFCSSCSSCYYSSGLRMSEKMIFCLGDGRWESTGEGYQKNLRIFNKGVTEEVYEKVKNALDVRNFKLPVAKWIDIKEIDKPTTTQKQCGGYLKVLNYQDAWKEMWSGMYTDDKTFIKNIPNFSAEIFEKITSIKVEDEVSLKGKKVSVELDGKKYTATIDEIIS
jgi:hypothetical protein